MKKGENLNLNHNWHRHFSKIILASSFFAGLGLLVATTQIQTQADTIANTPVYRLYNKTTKEHLYTINSTEYNTLANSKSHWIKEGIAFNAPTLSKIPVYRLYNRISGEHFYTTDAAKVAELIKNGTKSGWRNDSSVSADYYNDKTKVIAFYSAMPTTSNIPVLSLYNPLAGIGSHFYTASPFEATYDETSFQYKKADNFNYEFGVAWYALGESDSKGIVGSSQATNFPIPDVPNGWTIDKPIDTSHYSNATYNYRQCTWFAWNRARDFGISYSPYMGNGQDWQNAVGYTVTTNPVLHSVVSFKAGQFGFSAQYGHVAFVEAIHPDGSILVSESGLGYSSLFVYQVFTAAEASQLHYVIGH